MIEKIVVITADPFNQRDFNRYGIGLLRNNGLDIEIWDISSCIHKYESFPANHEKPEIFNNVKKFTERSEILNAVSDLDKKCLINCFIEYSFRTSFVFRAISKQHIPYCVFGWVSFPNPYPVQKGFFRKIGSMLRKGDSLKINEIFHHFLKKILLKYHHVFGIAPASIILLSGDKSPGTPSYPIDDKTTRLWMHSLDYDIYLRCKDQPSNPGKITGVFLDEYLPFHPDFHDVGIRDPISPDNYYPKICDFFTMLEKRIDSRIVIAAHPRSDYDNLPDYFCGRIIIKGETARLVKESSFVIAHMSNSLDFAVLFHKPVVFITTDDLQKMSSGKNITGLYIQAIAAELGKIPVNIDQVSKFDWDKEMAIDEEAYSRHKSHYIKKQGTPEKPMWEIFYSHIRENFP
jgi:hypothetical protein